VTGPATGTGRLYLGWQYATPYPAPGPPPRRPTPPEREQVVPGWVAAQRREENRLSRPLRATAVLGAVLLAVPLAAAAAGWFNQLAAGFVAALGAVIAVVSVSAVWQGERALRERVAAERRRVANIRAESESKLFAWQAEHATRVREWQARRVAYEHQKRWYAVPVPAGVHRVDIAGGTVPGWSALLTTAAARPLAEGGSVTVLDLTESAVALDLIGFARSAGISPQVWLLPADLAALDLGRGLDNGALADVLALALTAGEDQVSTRDLAADHALLERVLGVLGGAPAAIGGVAAALRALAQAGDPADDVAAGLLDEAQADRLRAMFGNGATDRVVVERAWALEAQLRPLAAVGTAAPPAPSALRVLALGRQAGVVTGKVLAAYLTVALAHVLRQAEPGEPWRHTVFALGADRLRGDLLDRLSDACETSRTRLVLGYRTIGPHVKERLGRGNAAVGFMRLGNADDARAASEQIGTEHRFVLSQLTETLGYSVTDTTTSSYTSTIGGTGSVTATRSAAAATSSASGSGHGAKTGALPFAGDTTSSHSTQASESRTESVSDSVSAGISESTAWGKTTSAAGGASESLASAAQRSREFLVEQYELQQLPVSAMILSYAGPAGRELVLADTNPGIGGLGTATMHTLGEFAALPPIARTPAVPAGRAAASQTGSAASQTHPVASQAVDEPNLGPPPPRLDWRGNRP